MATRAFAAAVVGAGVGAWFTAPKSVSCTRTVQGANEVYSEFVFGKNQPASMQDYDVSHDAKRLNIRKEKTGAEQARIEEGKQPAPTHQTTKQHGGVLTMKWQPFKLGEIINLTEETAIFRFLLPNADDEFVLEPCSTLQVLHRVGSSAIEQTQRMYTPITPSGTKGYFDIVVKKQRNGRMSEHLFSMHPGESMQFRVLNHKLRYLPNVYEHIGMIGAGSGITPLLQVIRANVANGPEDKTKISLLFANPTNHRVLLKGTLDKLAEESNGKFKPYYTVDHVVGNEGWDGMVGLIDEKKIVETMPRPDKRNLIMVCGSDKLLNAVCGTPLAILKPWSTGHAQQPAAAHSGANMNTEVNGMLGALGYSHEHVYKF